MPGVTDSCAGDTPRIPDEAPDETDITQSFEPPPAQSAGPPPGLIADVWPWLAALGVLAVAGLLVWLIAFRGHDRQQRRAVPQVVGLQERAAIARLTGAGY